jgi:hypothetical protein
LEREMEGEVKRKLLAAVLFSKRRVYIYKKYILHVEAYN